MMSIRLGIYDFFAYIVPGGLYISLIVYILATLGVINIDFLWLNNINITQLLIFAIFSYIAGLMFDPLARLWYKLGFRPKNFPQVVLAEVKKEHPSLKINFQPEDWSIFRAYIQGKNSEIGIEIEKLNATGILHRNISLGFLFFAIFEVILYFKNAFMVWDLVLAASGVIISILSVRRTVGFDRWFYVKIFETYIADNLESSGLLLQKSNVQVEIKKEPELVTDDKKKPRSK